MGDEVNDSSVLQELMLSEFPEVKALWDQTQPKREIAIMLSGLRKAANLSQKDIANITGWHKSVVSRLESPEGGVPDLQTIAKFAQACSMETGLIVGKSDEEGSMR